MHCIISVILRRMDPTLPENTITPLRTLGNTNIKITPIGLGMMEFCGWRRVDGLCIPGDHPGREERHRARALEGGINWFDTAELYGVGVSEASLAEALKACRQER